MKRIPLFLCRILPIWLLLSGCGAAGPGPQAWIDTPLDQTTAPLGPISILAHASDSEGVTRMEFYVNGQLQEPSVTPIQDSGISLFHAEKEFTPPGPGVYQIEVLAVDSAGNNGAPASSTVTILDETASEAGIDDDECPPDCPIQPEEAPPEELPPAEPPEEPPIETKPIVVAKMDANCREGPGTAYEIYGSLLEGQQAEIKGRLSDTSWLLIALEGRSSNCWISIVTVDVQGDPNDVSIVSAPPPPEEPPPAVDIIPPEPLEVVEPDTTPPGIFGAAANKSAICPSETVTVNVVTGDEESPVSRVYANWTITGAGGGTVDSGYVEFSPISGQPYGYTAQIKSANAQPGTLTITGIVENSASPPLTATFTVTVTINPC